MAEIERNPLAVRQGAAAVACIAAAAIAMPVISHRAAEQRDGAEWAARSGAYAELQQELRGGSEPNARVELTAFRAADGLRARGSATLFADGADTHAMLVQAALRGPLSPGADAAPVESQVDARQARCLSEAIYYEARGENYQGQVAVAEVVMNRVRSKHYPNTVCGVVYQGSHRVTGCQFTFTCDGAIHRRPRGRAWERAQQVATQVMLGYARPVTMRATHYHTRAVNPVWNSGLVETTRLGSHIFYRFPNSAERPVVMEALARRRAAIAARRLQASDDLIPPAAEAAAEALGEAVEAAAAVEATPPGDAPIETAPPAQTDAALQTPEIAT